MNEKEEPARDYIFVWDTVPPMTTVELIEVGGVKELEPQRADYEQPSDGRASHIAKRIERKHYRQWEQNLRSKMRARVS